MSLLNQTDPAEAFAAACQKYFESQSVADIITLDDARVCLHSHANRIIKNKELAALLDNFKSAINQRDDDQMKALFEQIKSHF